MSLDFNSPEYNSERVTAQRVARKEPQTETGAPDFERIINSAINDGHVGIEGLNRVFGPGVRWMLSRRHGALNIEASVQQVFASVIEELRGEAGPTPESLSGVVRRAVKRIMQDSSESEPIHVPSPDVVAAQKVIQKLSSRDREILVRYYVGRESRERICQDLDLPERQFTRVKSLMRSRFAEIEQRPEALLLRSIK